MSNLIGRTVAAAAVVALAGAGFAGTAFAWGEEEGGNGTGGTATNNCLNIGIPILSGTGIAGHGLAVGAQCNATANGTGGDAD